MGNFDTATFFIGLLLGMIIMLILVWIAYYSRTFVFTYCPTQARPCGGVDYYNNPGEALGNDQNLQASDILFKVKGDGKIGDKLLYTRVPRNTSCVPEGNQTVRMPFPQYCIFSGPNGNVEYRDTAFNSNIYNPSVGIGPTIITAENCVPSSGFFTSGTPEVKWDPIYPN